ncbi:MAG: M50 family metallopeptidase [Myxococcota bacterium]|jgi:hypothetical protein
MRIAFKIIFVLLSIPLIAGLVTALMPFVVSLGRFTTRDILFLSGAAAGVVLYPLMRMRKFFRTFEHETTHMIAAKMCLANMESMTISSSGNGQVSYTRESNFFIALAPYFLPLFALCFTILAPLLHPKLSAYALVPAGFLLTHHLLASFEEAMVGQPDIHESGRIFSIAFIGVFGLLIYGIIIAFAVGGLHGSLTFVKRTPVASWHFVSSWIPLAWHWIAHTAGSLAARVGK